MLFLDTGGEFCEGVGHWGCMPATQVAWLESKLRQLIGEHPNAHILTFLHIPLPEYLQLWNNHEARGVFRDSSVGCAAKNTGLFRVLAEYGGRVSVFAGHDHANDFHGEIDGVGLFYGRKSGFGPYAPPDGTPRHRNTLHSPTS